MHICQDEIMAASAGISGFLAIRHMIVPWLKEKCGIGCKHEEDVHDCGSCEVDFECEPPNEDNSP